MSHYASQPIENKIEKENAENDRPDPHPAMGQPSQGGSISGDGSAQIFSMYSKATQEEDNRMVKTLEKDSDGILIFSGLFSAAVAAFLTVTIQDLRPNSQDTSAFHLGNIYEVLADPNATRASIPFSVAKPPPFSPPTYAIWVNSLWFLSFVFSLICALSAMTMQQYARRHIMYTQPIRCNPERQARAYFYKGPQFWIARSLAQDFPRLLHLSLLLFFGGLCIFLFNANRAVFNSLIWLMALFLSSYGSLLLIRVGGRFFLPENLFSEKPQVFNKLILLSLMETLDDDDALETFFKAVPDFFISRRVNIGEDLLDKIWDALNGFFSRTLSSDLAPESVKSRLDIGMSAMNVMYILRPSWIFYDIFVKGCDPVPEFAEMDYRQLLTYCSSEHQHIAHYAQCLVARILASVPTRSARDESWNQSTTSAFGLPDLRDYISRGDDSASLSILIHLIRQSIDHRFCDLDALKAFSKFDIRHTLPGLQHDFCTLWNEIVQEAKNGRSKIPFKISREIRHLYISLHQGTDAASTPIARFAVTFTIGLGLVGPVGSPLGFIRNEIFEIFVPDEREQHRRSEKMNMELCQDLRRLYRWFNILISYPQCDIASHRPGSAAHLHTANFSAVSISTQPGNFPDASLFPPFRSSSTNLGSSSSSNLTTTSEIGGNSYTPIAMPLTIPVHSSLHPTSASPTGVAAVMEDITSATLSSHPTGNNIQQAVEVPCTTQGVVQTSSSLILSKSLTSPDAVDITTSRPLPPALSVVRSSIPASPPLSRGLVNAGSMCFANAVLQLLVHSPPFWNLFKNFRERELLLGDLTGQRGEAGPDTCRVAIPLVNATVRFLEEFTFEEKEQPPKQQSRQQTAGREPREDEEGTKVHMIAVDSFEPTYMYDAMKHKRQLERLLNGKHQDAEEFLCLYLDALDGELVELHTCISTRKPAPALSIEGFEGALLSEGLTEFSEVGKRDYTASLVESPISSIFGGRSRSTVRTPSQPDSITVETWLSLQLDIQPDSVHTIQDALARVSLPQPVQISQSNSSEASQQVHIEVLPSILVLHLKRFLYDAAADGISKINKPVQFTPELKILPGIIAPVAGRSADPVHYKLYGVLYHHGQSAEGGHYTVDVLHPNGNRGGREVWLHIDDETVTTVQHEEMFEGLRGKRDENRSAYVLFYCRIVRTASAETS